MAFHWHTARSNKVLGALNSPSPICRDLHTVLDVLNSHRARHEPAFAEEVLLNYLQTKAEKGMPSWRVSEKLTRLEKAMVRRGILDFSAQIIQIRTHLSLPASQIFPFLDPNASSSAFSRPPPPPANPQLYLPLLGLKDKEVLPAYSVEASVEERARGEALV